MFQFTRNKTSHDAKEVGLRAVDGLKFPSETRRYYIAVTPEDLRPKINVPFSYLTKQKLGKEGADDVFPVYHLPVNRKWLFKA